MKMVIYIRCEVPDLKEGETFTDMLNATREKVKKEFDAKKVFIDVL